MSRHQQSAERYQRIAEILDRRGSERSVVKLKELAEELEISLRQLNEDFRILREHYQAPLEYDKTLRGWRFRPGESFAFVDKIPLTRQDILHLRIAVETLARLGQLRSYQELPAIFAKIHRAVRHWSLPKISERHIYFDPTPMNYPGGRHLTFMLDAIESWRRVRFNYQAFTATEARPVVFDPWFLRQYGHRWYAGGFSHAPEEGFVRTFPLERIIGEPEAIGFYHDKPRDYDASTYWKDIYGITVPPGGQVETVVIRFSRLHGQYFLSAPFFTPFEVLENTETHLTVSLRLILNIELVRKLASLGSDAQVLAPEVLVNKVRNFLVDALNRMNS